MRRAATGGLGLGRAGEATSDYFVYTKGACFAGLTESVGRAQGSVGRRWPIFVNFQSRHK